MKRRRNSGGFGETLRTVFWAVVIALVIRTLAFEPFSIPSGSMIPTLLIGDYLFVSKYSYGYSRHSLPLSLPLIPGRIMASAPERGDVAVFKVPTDNKTDYIKRVIGLPGDKIKVREGRLYINGEMVPREFVATEGLYDRDSGGIVPHSAYMETLPNGVRHLIYEKDDNQFMDNTEEFTVPEGEFFMMGDNRDHSLDSRASFSQSVGLLPKEERARLRTVPLVNFVGRAEILFFSSEESSSLWKFWKWPDSIRFSRFFNSID